MTVPAPAAMRRHEVTWSIGHPTGNPALQGARGMVEFEATAVAIAYSEATVLPSPVSTPVIGGVMTPVELIENTPGIWNWRVRPRLGVQWAPFHIDVDEPVDLASAATTPGAGPVRVVKGDRGAQGASLASLEQINDETLRAIIDDPLTGASDVEDFVLPRGPEGPYGGTEVTDPQVASYLDDTGSSTRQAISSSDWFFGRGHTTEGDRTRVAVEREYSTGNGDLFNSTARVEISMRNQEGTSQNPPGYSSGSIALVENGENGEQYQGESARMLLISNRILFNRRLEVDMGGDGRAGIYSGTQPGQQLAYMTVHNSGYPRVGVYGPDNQSHGGNRQNVVVVDRGTLEVHPTNSWAQTWLKRDANDIEQRVEIRQYGAGHQNLNALHGGEMVGQIRFEPTDKSIRLTGGTKVILQSDTEVEGALFLTSNPTTSYDPNAFINAGTGQVRRSTSSRRYKKNIADWSPEAGQVLALRPRTWQHDDPSAPIDETWHVGFVAEEVADLGLTGLVHYAEGERGEWRPEALNYSRFAAAHQVVLQKHEAEISAIKKRIKELEDDS